MLGVALVKEGVELRQAGIDFPILVQCCPADYETDALLDHALIPTITSYDAARRFSEKASALHISIAVHLDIDTGMGRIGFAAENAVEEIQKVSTLPGLKIEGIYTHFSTAEIENDPHTLEQLRVFETIIETLAARDIRPRILHAANSSAIINYPQSHLTLVRPGLILYGVYPDKNLRQKITLQPALRLETAIAFLKEIKPGTSLGYGRSFTATEAMRIATANVGYADGYPWRLSNNAKVLIRGTPARIVGRVSMDQLLIDVTAIPDAEVGECVTLLGEDGSERVTAEDLAECAGTIPYEILCRISGRVSREYRP
jgi:alanine racemase